MATNNAINANSTTPLSNLNGGTGVSNSFTLTVGGNLNTASSFTTSGANPLTLTTTGTTNATIPSGTNTLVVLPGSASLTTLGTVTTGTWNATVISATYGGTGLANPTAHGILVGEGSSAVNPITLSNGQLLIGSTGADPVAATITAGNGISVTNGAGTITIAATGDQPYTEVTTTTQTMVADNEYTANNAGLVTLTLPATAAIGTTIIVNGKGAGGWTIAQNASQLIHFGNQVTTTGTGGSLASTNQWDNIRLKNVTANTTWVVQSAVGNLTVV